MKLIFYFNRSDNKKVNKNLTFFEERDCQVKTPCDAENPYFTITAGADWIGNDVNYCYCPDLKRYYFIEKCEMINGTITGLVCRMDYLQTYSQGVLNLTCLVERQEFIFNNFIRDDLITLRGDKIIDSVMIGAIGEHERAVITVNGG